MQVQSPYFEFIRDGKKKIEGRKISPKWNKLTVGQDLWIIHSEFSEEKVLVKIVKTIKFTKTDFVLTMVTENLLPEKIIKKDNVLVKIVKTVNFTEDDVLTNFLSIIGVENLLPDKITLEEGREVYLSFFSEEDIEKFGMQAIFIETI